MRTRRICIIAVGVLAIVIAVASRPARLTDLRRFDPKAVARLETDMWRSYYDHRRFLLFRQLATLLREQYHMPWLRARITAYHAAKAAVVFQRGHNRAEYERALPDLVDYYSAIRDRSSNVFDSHEAARRELEWWIVHRERDRYAKQALVQALAAMPECIYHRPAAAFEEHASARAEAMMTRDDRAAAGGVSEANWSRIGALLDRSWTSLWHAVQD